MDLNNVTFTWLEGHPKSWEIKRVKHLFRYSKEKVDSPDDYPILSLTMRGVVERDVSTNEGQLPETYNGYSLLRKNQIVFNPMDLISGWVDTTEIEGMISPSYKIIEPYVDNINVEYYKYFFQKHYRENILFPFGEGVHYQYRWGLGSETLLNFPVLCPPLSEQNIIVDYLNVKSEKIDRLIKFKVGKIELLKEKKTSLINHVVTKGINEKVDFKDSGINWIGLIPSSWELSKVKYVSKVYGRIGFRGYKTTDLVEEGEGVITLSPSNIVDGKLSLHKRTYLSYEKYYESPEIIIKKDDLIYVQRGSSIGKSTIIPDSHPEMTINPQLIIIKDFKVLPKFLYYVMNSEIIRIQTDHNINGGSTPLITQNSVENFVLPIPQSIEEQSRIVDFIDSQTNEIDDLIKMEKNKIELLKEFKQSLISEVVTGRKRVYSEEHLNNRRS